MTDIAKFLNYEIKKELADRYFGFRKLIEEDKELLVHDIYYCNRTVGKRIVEDLNRMYILLKGEKLIQTFLDLTGMEEKIYFDQYILTSPTIRARIFAGVKTRGLTAAGRFKNLVMITYEQLVTDVEEYREKYEELLISQETIEEEIKIFYRQNDISSIMGFLRNMDVPSAPVGVMQGTMETGFAESMEKKLRLSPPVQVATEIPIVPPLIPLPQIKKQLKKLAEQALLLHDGVFQLP
jgi:hypothetical protein